LGGALLLRLSSFKNPQNPKRGPITLLNLGKKSSKPLFKKKPPQKNSPQKRFFKNP